MDAIAVKPFLVHGEAGVKFMVEPFTCFKVLSGLGFIRIQEKNTGLLYHADEMVLGKELLSYAQYITEFKGDPDKLIHIGIVGEEFLSAEDMSI